MLVYVRSLGLVPSWDWKTPCPALGLKGPFGKLAPLKFML